MLFKFCPRCNCKMDYSRKYCNECEPIVEQEQLEKYQEFLRVRDKMSNKKERYKKYAHTRKDGEFQAFYNSIHWRRMRKHILITYKYVDIFEYYRNGNIVQATMVHHIVDIKSNYELRLEELNLIPLSDSSHTFIHNEMDKGNKEAVIKELNEMIERYRREILSL